MIHYRHTLELMKKFRFDYFNQLNAAGLLQLKQFCSENNKVLYSPYFEKDVYNYFYDKTWEEINKPKQKSLIRNKFPELEDLKLKPHINYQLCANVDTLFETLIDNKKINFKKRKRVMDICRDWSKI